MFREPRRHLRQRQKMPVHFGSPKHHFHTISSPLATQIPQAAGMGYALRRSPDRRSRSIAACFFSEGAASEGDFHTGLLLASTIPSPSLFIARNNGHHNSSDDSFVYRQRSEVEDRKRVDNPIARFRLSMESHRRWDAVAEEELKVHL
ncbi:2-oxoisovalerate dehydrogenase subunit alpha [Mycena venus]|uniref:2-oxoisovalerate dehydrogenase subunit alpha n=1 Tax=Mycena venus TaxID=2733690 RepID=A0A8H6YHH2_9AGAR|nr:2-oxoisovalerate dehydrogenase subunit alpha [Mycena venus]